MIMQMKLPLATLSAALLAWSGQLVAQAGCSVDAAGPSSCTAAHGVQADVNMVATLNLSTDVTQFTVAAADFGTPKLVFGPTVTVSANTTWTLSVASLADMWGGGDGDKPSTDLQIVYNGGSPMPMSTTSTTVATGGAGTSAPAQADLSTTWSYTDDPPGNYTLGLLFTLATP
jgi:hypothetical protein